MKDICDITYLGTFTNRLSALFKKYVFVKLTLSVDLKK